jgi:hypothetical protein
VAIGPVPLLTARGAGRLDLFERPRPEREDFVRDRLPDDRVVVEDVRLDVPRFRDAGGEDVRVAMVTI